MFSPFSYEAPSSYRIFSFAKVLTAWGHQVAVVLPSYDRYSEFSRVNVDTFDGVHLERPFQLATTKQSVNMASFAFSSSLKSLSIKSDIIHVLKPTPIAFSAYQKKVLFKSPIVQDIDDLDHEVMSAEHHSRSKVWVMKQCEQIIPRFADQIVVSSSALKNFYSQSSLTKNITQISNGVFVNDFRVDLDTNLKGQYGLKEKVVVYVGSLNNEAQISQLIFSMKIITKERKDVSCLVVGGGSARQKLQQLASTLHLTDSVIFTGNVPHSQIPQLLSISDVGFACFPKFDYLKYASNIKVFEYMAAGCPPIVSPQGDLPFYVNYGRAGCIVEPTVSSISQGLLELLSDDKKRRMLAQNSKEHVINFDWSVLSSKLINIYRKVA